MGAGLTYRAGKVKYSGEVLCVDLPDGEKRFILLSLSSFIGLCQRQVESPKLPDLKIRLLMFIADFFQ
jgi:hypothetical protein